MSNLEMNQALVKELKSLRELVNKGVTQESLEKILDSKLDSKLYAVVDSVNLSVDKKLTDFHSEIDKKIDDVK